MPRPSRIRTASTSLGAELGREYDAGPLLELLLTVANEAPEAWKPLIEGWRTVHGDLVTDAGLDELRGMVRADLTAIAVDGGRTYSRGAGAVTLTWWYSGQGGRFARQGVSVEVASRDLAEYLDWALLVLLLRGDAARLRACHACGAFWIVKRAGATGKQGCPTADCRRTRNAAARARQRRESAAKFRRQTTIKAETQRRRALASKNQRRR